MTSKAESLVRLLDETAYSRNGSAEHSKAYSALVCYIKELESKATAYDEIGRSMDSRYRRSRFLMPEDTSEREPERNE